MMSIPRPHDAVVVMSRHRLASAILFGALLVIIGASLPQTFPIAAIGYICVRSLGVAYIALFGLLLTAVLKRRDFSVCASPPYVIALALAIFIALRAGWTNADLELFYQNWGRAVLSGGLPSLYDHVPGEVNYPPVYPAILGVSALLAGIANATADPYLAPFFYRLAPIAGLFLLPIVVGALVSEFRGTPSSVRRDRCIALVTAANPAFFYISVPWGQTDIFLIDFMLVSMLAFVRGRAAAAGVAIAFALLVKLQAAFIMPALIGWVLAKRDVPVAVRAAGGFAAASLIILPVSLAHTNLIGSYAWLAELYRSIANSSNYVSSYAATLFVFLSGPVLTTDQQPAPFGGTFLQESLLLDAVVGIGLIIASAHGIRKHGPKTFAWYAALSTTFAYYCSVHVHERYLAYGTVAALVWALVSPSGFSWTAAALMTIVLLAQSLIAFDIPLGPWGARSLVMDHFTVPQYFNALMVLLAAGILCLVASGIARARLGFDDRVAGEPEHVGAS